MTLLDRLNRPSPGRRFHKAWPALALACLASQAGCGREFFRNWADQDVTEAVFEKSRDPRWNIPLFSIEPPSMSRFVDPYDPDRPPAPPDDPAAEALSPVPQWPHHRLLVPAEGTGYLDMLEGWKRDRPYRADEQGDADRSPPPPRPRPMAAPPAPSTETPPPFQFDSPPPTPTPDFNLEEMPGPDGSGLLAPGGEIPDAGENSGLSGEEMSPTSMRDTVPENPRSLIPDTTSGSSNLEARSTSRDPGVQLSAFQTPGAPAAAPTADEDSAPQDRLPEGINPPVAASPGEAPTPSGVDPLSGPPGISLDPEPFDVDLRQPADPRMGMTPEGFQEAGRATAGLSALLSPPTRPFSHTEAAALPENSDPYMVTPMQALTLALINSRAYQLQIENVYLAALTLTLQRWNFTPQVNAGLSPQTATAGGLVGPNFPNSFLYRTIEAPGGQSSVTSLGFLAGFGKAFSFGGRLLGGFANQTVFNFTGINPTQPRVESILPLNFVQPFLRGGGRAVTLEPLTLAERNLLYSIRDFARFRQTFFPSILTSGLGIAGAGGDQVVGYLNVLQLLQRVENDATTVAAFETLLAGYEEMSQGGGSGVSQLNVQQIDLDLQSARQTLLQDTIAYQNALDRYKIQLGLPPDTPIVLDRGMTRGFREVFERIDDWFTDEDREPEVLPDYVAQLPSLPDVILDGRPVVAMGLDTNQREDVLLAAERIALENRFDLMNQRGQLYDAWRQLAVRANALKGVFNIGLTNQVFTPTANTNPFAFSDQASQFNLTMNTELPLVRLNERNIYRQGVILYRQQQRALMSAEDQIKLTVRVNIRQLIQLSESYEIQQRSLVVALQSKDNTQRQIFAPPGQGDQGSAAITANTTQLTSSQSRLLQSQNLLIQIWVNYITQRIGLYSDLGIIPYDEWEAFYELFPSESTGSEAGGASAGGAGPPPAAAADPPPRRAA